MALKFWRDPFMFPILITYIYIMYDIMDITYDKVSNNKAPDALVRHPYSERETGEKISHKHGHSTPIETKKITQQRHPFEGVYSRQIFDCANIHKIQIKEEIGRGVSKQAYLGVFEGTNYVVKMATEKVPEVADCVKNLQKYKISNYINLLMCYEFANMKILLEILILHQIQHKNLAQLVGYCVRNNEFKSLDLRYHGIISVFEYGEHITRNDIKAMTWQYRIKHASELSSLLQYFAKSPLGSLLFPAISLHHFLKVGDHIKMIDLDGIVSVDPNCKEVKDCMPGLLCQNGACVGYNSKKNMKNMRNELFYPLFSDVEFPANVLPTIQTINASLASMSIDADKMVDLLKAI